MPSTLSSKYQIVIPAELRERFNLKPGMQFEFIALDGQIQLVPIKPTTELKGLLTGKDVSFTREENRF